MSQPIPPPIPTILTPPSGGTVRNSYQILWTDTASRFDYNGPLDGVSSSAYYKLQISTSPLFTTPTEYTIWSNGGGNNFYNVTAADGSYNVRIKAGYIQYTEKQGIIVSTMKYESDWSSPTAYNVSATLAIPDQQSSSITDNLDTFIPIILGEFSRDAKHPKISNGLAIGYFTQFAHDTVIYSVAEHRINPPDGLGLSMWIPAGTGGIIQVVGAEIFKNSDSYAAIRWATTDGKYWATQEYIPSNYPLSAPFVVRPYTSPSTNLFNAVDRDNVIDDDPSTKAKLRIQADSGHYTDSNNSTVYVYHVTAAWEISDEDQTFKELIKDPGEIYVTYENLFFPKYSSGAETYNMTLWFRLCTEFNADNPNTVVAPTIGKVVQWDPAFYPGVKAIDEGKKLNVAGQFTLGPLATSAFTSFNRNPALYIDAPVSFKNAVSLNETPITIGTLRVSVRKAYTNVDQAKQFKIYVGAKGLAYDTWLLNFTTDNGYWSTLQNLYLHNPGSTTIEDGAMMIVALCRNYAGLLFPSDYATDEFARAIKNPVQTMRYNITDENVTVRDAIKNICHHSTFNCDMLPSGKMKCFNIRTTAPDDTVDDTITYQDVDISSYSLGLTALDKVVNTIQVKSRYCAEQDKWIDFDTYTNSVSAADTKYGTRKPKDIIELPMVNSGPVDRDTNNISKSILNNNPVKYQIVHLINPDMQNGHTDPNNLGHGVDGWLSEQHPEISFKLPGYAFMRLEKGSIIQLDNATFSAQGFTCFNQSWAGKRFMIQSITKDQDSVTINSAVQLPAYSMFELRGLALISKS